MSDGLEKTQDADDGLTLSPRAASSPLDDTAVGSTFGRSVRGPSRRQTEPEKGTLVGRYVVISKLGAGAMGVVLAAYDPQLDRKVALKLLRLRGLDRAAAQVRLQREAQALARLSHPNVVSVHDVGLHDDRVFVAMEFVDGQTLTRWCETAPGDGPRPWREVLRVFEAAGQGLRAAHAQGLVHRDFKPDNVMIGDDGRVRVMDFGLARSTEMETHERRELEGLEGLSGPSHDSLQTDLTNTGALMGTPAYMAPEQFLGGAADGRSDQFAYCVALYEALYGERPYWGDSVAELAQAAASGKRAAAPRGSQVPSWLRRVVLRGMSARARLRYASMSELQTALGAAETRRRRRRRSLGALVVLGVGASALGVYHYDRTRRIASCAAGGDAIDEVWNDDARDALHRGLVTTGVDYAPAVAERVMPWLEDYARQWRRSSTEACENAEVHETWSRERLHKARWCLEERRRELLTLVTDLAVADELVVQRAVEVASTLSPLVPCVDGTSLDAMPEPPTGDERARLEEASDGVAQMSYLEKMGKYAEGLEVGRGVQEQAEAIDWPPLTVTVLHKMAWLHFRSAEYEEAERLAVRAYMRSVEVDLWDVAAATAIDLTHLVGSQQARAREGKLWARLAELALAKAGDPTGLREAKRLNSLGNIHYAEGEHPEASARYEQALTMAQAALGPRHPFVADLLNNLGNVHFSLGEKEESMASYERALEIRRELLGPQHPRVASSLTNLGVAHAQLEEHEVAKGFYQQALAILEKVHGPDHPEVATNLNNLAWACLSLTQYDEARALFERALTIKQEVLGPTHPSLFNTLSGLGRALVELDEHGTAIVTLDRLLGLPVAQSRPETSALRFRLAEALWDAPAAEGGDRHRARSEAARALEGLTTAGESAKEVRAEAEKWLAEHPEPAP